jgi:hypothetical protein
LWIPIFAPLHPCSEHTTQRQLAPKPASVVVPPLPSNNSKGTLSTGKSSGFH